MRSPENIMVKKATKKPTKKKAEKAVEPDKEQKAKPASKAQAAKVFDITAPGKSMPSSNARPIIITHRSVVQDPMVSAHAATPQSTEAGESITINRSKRIRIEPLHADDLQEAPKQSEGEANEDTSDAEATPNALQAIVGDVEDEPSITTNLDAAPEPPVEDAQKETPKETEAAPAAAELSDEPASPQPDEPAEPESEPESEPALDETLEAEAAVSTEFASAPAADPKPTPEPEPEPEPAPAPEPQPADEPDEVDAMAAQAVAKKGKKNEETEAAEALAAAKKLAESKQYNVPISSPHGGHVAHAVLGVFVALLVIAVVGGILAIDAEIIDVNIDLPFDLL